MLLKFLFKDYVLLLKEKSLSGTGQMATEPSPRVGDMKRDNIGTAQPKTWP